MISRSHGPVSGDGRRLVSPIGNRHVDSTSEDTRITVEVRLVHYEQLSHAQQLQFDSVVRRATGFPEDEPIEHIDRPDYIALNADTGQIVGFALTEAAGRSVNFWLAGVDPDFRDQGVYKALLRQRFEDVLADPQVDGVAIHPTDLVLRIMKKFLGELKAAGRIKGYSIIDERDEGDEDLYIKLKR